MVIDPGWVATEVDAFVLAGLQRRGLRPVRPAGKRELIRRATFDLLGLPPTPEEVADFERDGSPNAFARVVDRLLASPHYGERWGRYWLDVSRYADDKALAFPTPWPHAYRYRDWVVRALNEGMPYDQFLRLQLAGDLLPDDAGTDLARKLTGLGFQGLGAEYHKGSVPAQVLADELDDRIDTLTRGLLGLTVACARCHDHKFDPIPTRDYYSLAAAYNGAAWSLVTLSSPEEAARSRVWVKEGKDLEARIARWAEEQKAAIVRQELRAVGPYLLAAWRLRVLRKAGLATPAAERAGKEKLDPFFLKRTESWLATARKGKFPPARSPCRTNCGRRPPHLPLGWPGLSRRRRARQRRARTARARGNPPSRHRRVSSSSRPSPRARRLRLPSPRPNCPLSCPPAPARNTRGCRLSCSTVGRRSRLLRCWPTGSAAGGARCASPFAATSRVWANWRRRGSCESWSASRPLPAPASPGSTWPTLSARPRIR
jgi:hypothetical protein